MRREEWQADDARLRVLLRQLRLEAGLRQSDLAKRIGRPQSFVSKYESGERRLDFVEIRTICAAIGTDIERLVRLFEGSRHEA